MICVYAGTDEQRAGHGLGVLQPEECSVQEETGGSYEASLTLTRKRDWVLIQRGGVIRLPGAPHRLCAQEQLFRIYAYSIDADGLRMTVQARHLSYDGMNCFIRRVDADEMPLATLVTAMVSDTLGGPPLSYDLQADGSYTGTLELVNAVNALLAPENGVVTQCRLRLERDNCTMRLRPLGGEDSGLTLRWGRNVTSLPWGDSMDQVVTRLCPVGEDADGNQLLLPETYIDSPRLGDFPTPLYSIWAVSGAKVGQKKTDSSGNSVTLDEEAVYALLRKAAQEKLDGGCDLAQEETSAVMVDLRRAAGLERMELCLYDYLRLVHERAGIDRQVQLTGYTWDVLTGRYTKLELGQPLTDRTAHALVTQPQMREKINRQSVKALNLIDVQANSIRLLAYDHEELAKRTSEAEIKLDGQAASIELIATQVREQGNRISQAEINIDGANAAIELKANRTEVSDLCSRVSKAEVAIDGANAAIELKASQTSVDRLTGRVTSAEASIKVNADSITSKVSKDGVISAINQTAESVRISASKINLDGYVTMTKMEAKFATLMDGFAMEFSTTDLYASTITLGQSLSAPGGYVSANTIAASASMTVDGKDVATKDWVNSRCDTMKTWVNANYADHSWVAEHFLQPGALTTKTIAVVKKVSTTTATTPPFYNESGTKVSNGVEYVKSVSYETATHTVVVYA